MSGCYECQKVGFKECACWAGKAVRQKFENDLRRGNKQIVYMPEYRGQKPNDPLFVTLEGSCGPTPSGELTENDGGG